MVDGGVPTEGTNMFREWLAWSKSMGERIGECRSLIYSKMEQLMDRKKDEGDKGMQQAT